MLTATLWAEPGAGLEAKEHGAGHGAALAIRQGPDANNEPDTQPD
jgi:hypothetical protein